MILIWGNKRGYELIYYILKTKNYVKNKFRAKL
jgi:hypothetical protein